MKWVIRITWVLWVTSTFGTAKDWGSPEAQEHRQTECQKMSLEALRSASELEQRVSKTEDADSKKLLSDLAVLKKKESENFSKLAEAIRKKQWSSITQLEKKGGDLCQESSEKWTKLEKQEAHLAKTKPLHDGFKNPPNERKPSFEESKKPLPPPIKRYPTEVKSAEPSSPKTLEPAPAAHPAASPESDLQ